MPKIRSKRNWGGFFPEYELRRRETGFKCNIGWEGRLKYSLYSSLHPCNSWDPIYSYNRKIGDIGVHHGGIFNLEFSPDGSQLVAACEKKAIMIFDPLTRKQIYDVVHAHASCVNGIKFLDNRVFATCSDDKTVALWDIRNLSRKIVRLYGHDNWVKNIEYSSEDGLLVTSGFDGRILGWNINKYAEDNDQCSELFSMQGLMRIKLAPDLTKLIICTTGGYMVAIHNLSLKSLDADLQDFKPNMYRLMQISNTPFPQSANFTRLFYRKRNQIEFISDFPPDNDAEVIHSLQVHPQGWCVLSRNTSARNSSEWTCVHDIQEQEMEKDELKEAWEAAPADPVSLNGVEEDLALEPRSNPFYVNSSSRSQEEASEQSTTARDLRLAFTISPRVEVMLRQMPRSEEEEEEEEEDDDDDDDEEEEDGDEERSNEERRERRERERNVVIQSENLEESGFDVQLRLTSMNFFEAVDHLTRRHLEQRRQSGRSREGAAAAAAGPSGVPGSSSSASRNGVATGDASRDAGEERPSSPHRDFRLRQRRDTEANADNRDDYISVFFTRPEIYSHRSILVLPPWNNNYGRTFRNLDKNHKIAKNVPRLTNFIEEPNKGKGFIKELCFSSDGRLICSPFDCGVRLMMFDEKCSELSHCVQKVPQQLCTVSNNICHTNCVVSTKFSPVDCLLVSGCLNGKIVWHQPII